LKPDDFFGEIAIIDEGTRMATVTAASDLVCYGRSYGDFRPLVESNGVIGWKLLQRMARMLRAARE
jgi:CRP/FNR family cyclic AMP-dependent transcriptional regulator